jgi:hypothetical protein
LFHVQHLLCADKKAKSQEADPSWLLAFPRAIQTNPAIP